MTESGRNTDLAGVLRLRAGFAWAMLLAGGVLLE